jgi:hypothetical protein
VWHQSGKPAENLGIHATVIKILISSQRAIANLSGSHFGSGRQPDAAVPVSGQPSSLPGCEGDGDEPYRRAAG